MPKIVGGNKIIFDQEDFLNGLHPQYGTSLTATPYGKMTNKLVAASAFNPYRFMGYAAPGYLATDVTNVSAITDKIMNGVVGYESSVAYGYLIGANNLLHQLVISSNTISTGGAPWPHTITGVGAETGSDVINYTIGSTRYIFYSYNDSGANWNIGRYSLDGATFDDDWFTTVPAGFFATSGNTEPHPMKIGQEDVLYIGDGNKVHAFDGGVSATGTVYQDVLVLPSGYRITGFARLPDYLVVFAFFNGSGAATANTFTRSTAQAFAWNYLDGDATRVYELDDNAVTAAFEYKGTIGCFTKGRRSGPESANRYSKLKLFNGSTFETVQEFIGNAPPNGSVDILNDIIQFNSDGILHQYGSPYEGLPIGLNKTGAGASTGTSTNAGFCRTLDPDQGVLLSTGSGTSGGLQRFQSNYALASHVVTSVIEPEFPEGKCGKVKSVTIYYAKTCSGGNSLTVSLQDTINGTSQIIDTVTAVTASGIVKKYTVKTNSGEMPRFDVLRVLLQWAAGAATTDAPIVRRIVVEFEATDLKPL